jgi:4-alpha-glucanotransferase
MIELALRSRASLAIVPAQDVLGLGSEARMNRPGETEGNWSWRLERGELDGALADRLREATRRARR